MIEGWCDSPVSGLFGAMMKDSFLPGCPLDPGVLTSDGEEYGAKLSALKAVYAFYAGQRPPSHAESEAGVLSRGLFGGFSAYDIVCNMHWANPLFRAESETVVIAYDCFRMHEKLISMHLPSGQVLSVTRMGSRRATPISTDCSDGVDSTQEDSVLRWFEEHAGRLHRGHVSVGRLLPSTSETSLLQYPSAADTVNCSRAVTRGVEVIASAVFVPEVNVGHDGGGHSFIQFVCGSSRLRTKGRNICHPKLVDSKLANCGLVI